MALANIVINDASTPTPVAHTFVGIQDGSDARYVNEAGATTLKGQETLGLAIKRSVNQTQAHVARMTLWDPNEVVIDGIAVVTHGSSADCRFNFAPGSSEQERLNLITMLINGLTAKKSDMAKLLPQL